MKIKKLTILLILSAIIFISGRTASCQETLTPVVAPQTVFKTKLTPAETSAALPGLRGLVTLPNGVTANQLQSISVNFQPDGSAQVIVRIRPQIVSTNSP